MPNANASPVKGRILVVDDEPLILDVLREFLSYEGHHVICVASAEQAMRFLDTERVDLVLTDLKMPGASGVDLIRDVGSRDTDTACIVMTGFGTVETAIDAMKQGAFDYLLKPFKADAVITAVQKVLDRQSLQRENLALSELVGFYEVTEALSGDLDVDAQLDLLLRTAQNNLQASSVSLQVVDESVSGPWSDRASVGPHAVRRGSVQGALQPGTPVRVSGAESRAFIQEGPEAGAVMSVPLRARGRVVGALTAVSDVSDVPFTEGQRKGLSIFGARTVDALEQARMQGELRSAFTETLTGFARALEAKDRYTRGHSDRVAIYAKRIAEALGVGSVVVDTVEHGGLMHDIGKIALSSDALNKPGRLSDDEYRAFRLHPVEGRAIIEPISFLSHLVPCIYHHHESYNGRGYPDGLDGEGIPLEARILSVADAYDAMTSHRPYRRAMPHVVALAELQRCVNRQFDPDVVAAFCEGIESLRAEQRASGIPVPV